ncbi:DsrE/DsrF/TusD sulfur relay family protein [Actinosynnema sp. NPDC091369]
MRFLIVLHDPPYGTERTYNGIRWARQLIDADGNHEVKVFMFADAVAATADGQKTPNGFYNLAKMLKGFTEKGGVVGNCGTCMDARAIAEDRLVPGSHRSGMAELAEWTVWADKVINV